MCQLRSAFEVDFLNNVFLFKIRSILEVYFISKKVKKYKWKKYKQSTFLFFPVFILHLYFFLGVLLKAYFYWTSIKDLKYKWSIIKVYLKYTFYIVFSEKLANSKINILIFLSNNSAYLLLMTKTMKVLYFGFM